MKKHFLSKSVIALSLVIAAVGQECPANAQPVSSPANSGALPASIVPGSPVAQVVKLVQAGVDAGVIQSYISNCSSAFNLDADAIISLTDAGVPADMVNAMIAHDKNLSAAAAAPPALPSPVPVDNADSSPPPAPATDVTATDFNDTLAPYGQWVQVDGYGRCWRPTVVVYDSTWQPYCDRGRWVYTDCGWYWDSDYSWGITFHYGRWFNHPQYGWCWWPDTVWAPSWVTWRSGGDYCGWAPLPPFTVYQPGVGFLYRGANVSVGFDFGLGANCFTFVSVGNFCQPHPRNYCVPRQQAAQIYNQTTIINNYNSHNRTIVNNGVSVTVIGSAAHHPIQAVSIGTLVNTDRHGGHGQNVNHPARPFGSTISNGSASRPLASTGFRYDGTVPNSGGIAPANTRNQSQYNWPVTGGANRTAAQPYSSPGVVAAAPNNWSPAAAQRPQPHPDVRVEPRQVEAQTAFTAPVPVTEHSQRAEPHQNYSQAVPATPQYQNSSPNAGGRIQSWVVQSH